MISQIRTVDIVPPPFTGRLHIAIPGAPVGKGRPRFVRSTGRAYSPTETVRYENLIRHYGAEAMDGAPPLDVPLWVTLAAHMPVASSWSKRKQAAALAGMVRPGKPDLDNILKLASDALNGVVWVDDRQIARAILEKSYSDRPRLEIMIEVMPARART